MSCIPVRMCVVCPKVPASFGNPHDEEEATGRTRIRALCDDFETYGYRLSWKSGRLF